MTTKKATPQAVTLQVTSDHGRFHAHRHNRVLMDPETGLPLLRRDLVESMQAEGYRPEEPIMAYANEDGTYTVIDGHNRLFAAQHLGIPVAFIAHKRNGRAEWTPLKSSMAKRQWTAMDVCRAYAHEGNDQYAELLEYIERTGIKLSQAASVLYGQSAGSGNAIKEVKSGTFVIRNRMNAEILGDMVSCASNFIDWSRDDRFVNALSVLLFVDGFSPSQMKEKIVKYHEFLDKRPDRDGMIEMLDKVYNRNARSRLELVVETRKILAERRKGSSKPIC